MQIVEESKKGLNTKKASLKKGAKPKKISFHLKYQTTYGQEIYIYGNHPLLGNGQVEKAIPLVFLNESYCLTIK